MWPTIAAAVATFAVIFEFLALQLSSGNDPALGSSVNASATQNQSDPRPVLNRRIVKTKVVHLPPVESDDSVTAVAPTTSAPAPVTSSAPAPVTSAPAPAPAPVAPAPVTSSS
jgi:hypothetical protein